MTARTVILIGAGHAHLYVAARAAALAARGARVVLVDPGQFWYSGLATGMLGGMYEPAEDCLDPQALITAQGGTLIRDRALAVDTAAQRVTLAGGATLGYDYLSINVGSRVDVTAIPGLAAHPGLWPVKPVRNLWGLRAHLEARFAAGDEPRVAVIGGGPTGCEVAANLVALGRRHRAGLAVTLLSSSRRLVRQLPAAAAARLRRKLERLGVALRLGTRVARCEAGALVSQAGERIRADIVVPAMGLHADPLVHATGLPAHPSEGLRIGPALHSVADARVFAAGDCARLEGFDLPKLGVFGVRQAATIHANLLASLAGEALTAYRPQRRYLAILNLGDGTALGAWGPLWWQGRASLWLKDRIDRRFLAGYRAAR